MKEVWIYSTETWYLYSSLSDTVEVEVYQDDAYETVTVDGTKYVNCCQHNEW